MKLSKLVIAAAVVAAGASSVTTSALAQVEATRRGAGIGLLHSFIAEGDPGLVPVLPAEVDFRLQFALSTRRESRGIAAVAAVREALIAQAHARRDELVPPTR